MVAVVSLILPWASGCGDKQNESDTRGGTRVDGVSPVSSTPGIGAGDDVSAIKKEGVGKDGPGGNAATPYNGGGVGVAPPVSPAGGAQGSGDSNSGQTSGAKEGPGIDALPSGANPSPKATGPGTGSPPR